MSYKEVSWNHGPNVCMKSANLDQSRHVIRFTYVVCEQTVPTVFLHTGFRITQHNTEALQIKSSQNLLAALKHVDTTKSKNPTIRHKTSR